METITPYLENRNNLIFNRNTQNRIAFRIGNLLSQLYNRFVIYFKNHLITNNRCDRTQSL
jgi:hypothetical protein